MSETINIEALKFPIGEFKMPKKIDNNLIKKWIDEIKSFPLNLEEELRELSNEKLDWKYRPEGWNIKQVVHHCADSHINSLVRFKLALTENTPTIKPYMEALWAELPDGTEAPLSWSLEILKPLHKRWVFLLENISSKELKNAFLNPEHGKRITLEEAIATYAWHGKHHLAHVKQAKKFEGRFS